MRFDVMIRKVEKISTGKWYVRAQRIVTRDYTHAVEPASELKELVERHYDLGAEKLAVAILDALADCSAVEVLDFNQCGVQVFRSPLWDRSAISEFLEE